MLGAIAGDIIGSTYEGGQARTLDFPLFSPGSRFTDDTVLTVAIADAILGGENYGRMLHAYYRLYPHAGYGGTFKRWGRSDDPQPYNSFGNGSAMRVSPVAWAFADLDSVLRAAARSAEPTHNHPEGIKGAQAIAAAIFLARTGADKTAIRAAIETRFGYDLAGSVEALHRDYQFDVTCQGTVPMAMIAFLESDGYESAVRNAIYIGGDSDTLACIAGSVAEAFYGGVPAEIEAEALARLDERLREVVIRFREKYG